VVEANASEGGLLGAVAGVGGAVGRAVHDLFSAERGLGHILEGAQSSGQKFEVSRENILQAGKIIYDQSVALSEKNFQAFSKVKVSLGDEVNGPIAEAWNSRLVDGNQSYCGRIAQYVASLDNLCDQLREAAKQYGFTDEEIMASFGKKKQP
jgi:hypothetical protein